DEQPTVQRPFQLRLRGTPSLPGRVQYRFESIESDLFSSVRKIAHVSLEEDGAVSASWTLFPRRRGQWHWSGVNAFLRGPFQLIEKGLRLGETEIPVYPKLTTDTKN